MSNNAIVKCVSIKDHDAIAKAVEALKKQGVDCELKTNARQRSYYSHQEIQCPFVIQLNKSRYDVGLKPCANPEDGLEAVCDFHGGDIASQLGVKAPKEIHRNQAALGKFFQAYGQAAAINLATAQGHMLEDCYNDAEGNVQVMITA